MKRKRAFLSVLTIGIAGILTLMVMVSLASGQTMLRRGDVRAALPGVGTAFTYQGYLEQDGKPASSACDFQFSLWDGEIEGSPIGATQNKAHVTVTSGLFIAELNESGQFGDSAFNGQARWLQIAVRCPAGSGGFTTLSPRQNLSGAPYALGFRPGTSVTGALSGPVLALENKVGDGVFVGAAGEPLFGRKTSPLSNGLEVAGTEGHGLFVGGANRAGVHVEAAAVGLAVGSSGTGLLVEETALDGVRVIGAAGQGGDGVFVGAAGDPSQELASDTSNGFEIAGAEDSGLYVGRADWRGVSISSAADGVVIENAGQDGVWVQSASTGDGFQVDHAGNNGVEVNSAGFYAGYFNGSVRIRGTCSGCLQATFGVNVSDQVLQPGDIVTVQGVSDSGFEGVPMLMNVGPANPGQAVVGVVYGWAEAVQDEEQDASDTTRHLVPRSTPVAPGEFLSVIISGPLQVKISTASGEVVAGARLAAAENGQARALRTVTVDGIEIAEDAPTVGIALESVAAGAKDMIWVLVNPR